MKALLGVLVLVLSALIASSPAHAATWRHTDAVGDVLATDYQRDSTEVSRVDPREDLADLTRLTVDVSRERVQVAASIRSTRSTEVVATVELLTSKDDTFEVFYQRGGGAFPPFEVFVRRNGDRFTCDGIGMVRTTAGLVLRLPLTCLGSPYRVRVGMLCRAYRSETEAYYERVAQDDALRTGRYTQSQPRLGPWVVVG